MGLRGRVFAEAVVRKRGGDKRSPMTYSASLGSKTGDTFFCEISDDGEDMSLVVQSPLDGEVRINFCLPDLAEIVNRALDAAVDHPRKNEVLIAIEEALRNSRDTVVIELAESKR